jgi:hypothetical protein
MKDVRGGHVSAVRNAIFRTFGLHSLAVNRRRNSLDILQWKESKDVKDSYKKLFNDETAIESITEAAFFLHYPLRTMKNLTKFISIPLRYVI